MVRLIKERVERPVSPSRFPKESLAAQLLGRKEDLKTGKESNEIVKAQEERFNRLARIAVARTADPLNPQTEELFKNLVSGDVKKVLGEMRDPQEKLDSSSIHIEEIVIVQQELTRMFQETLQKHADKFIDTELLALTLAQLHEPSITSLDELLTQGEHTREHAIAVLSYDAALAIRPEGASVPKEQGEKEQVIQTEARRLNKENNLYYISWNQSVDGNKDAEMYHLEEAYDRFNRPYLKMCSAHTDKADKKLEKADALAQKILDAKFPTGKTTLPQVRLPFSVTPLVLKLPFLPPPLGFRDRQGAALRLLNVNVNKTKTTEAVQQRNATTSFRLSSEKRSTLRGVRSSERGSRKARKPTERVVNTEGEKNGRQSQKGRVVEGKQRINPTRSKTEKEGTTHRVIKLTVTVRPQGPKAPIGESRNISKTTRKSEAPKNPNTPSTPSPTPAQFESGRQEAITIPVELSEPARATGEVVVEALKKVEEQVVEQKTEEILVQIVHQDESKEETLSALPTVEKSEKKEDISVLVTTVGKQEAKTVSVITQQQVGDVERLLSERGVVQQNKTPNVSSDPSLKKRSKKGQAFHAITDLSVAAALPGSLDSQQHIREAVLLALSA